SCGCPGRCPARCTTRRLSGSGACWPNWRPPAWSHSPTRATRAARTPRSRTRGRTSRNPRKTPIRRTPGYARPASARTPSSRPGGSSASSAASPGAPDSSPRPSTYCRSARQTQDEKGSRFASVFAEGGFDLQTGNPPWVRPEWDQNGVLAELDPWFELQEKPPVPLHSARKAKLLSSERACKFFLTELTDTVGKRDFFGSAASYDLLVGTQPDFYRAFMIRTWRNIGESGVVGLLHPDTHFSGARKGALRANTTDFRCLGCSGCSWPRVLCLFLSPFPRWRR